MHWLKEKLKEKTQFWCRDSEVVESTNLVFNLISVHLLAKTVLLFLAQQLVVKVLALSDRYMANM